MYINCYWQLFDPIGIHAMLRVYTLSPFLVFAKDTNASRIWGAYTRDPARILPQSRLSQIVFGEAHRHNSSIGSRGTDSPPSSKERKGSADKGGWI